MQAHGWALLMTADEPMRAGLPRTWRWSGRTTAARTAALIGHMARANGHWKLFDRAAPSRCALFWGPHAYVSPTWYTPGAQGADLELRHGACLRPARRSSTATPGVLDGRWPGSPAVYEGIGRRRLGPGPPAARQCRRRRPGTSSPSASSSTRVETKIKLSQNRELEDRHRVIAKLEASDSQDAQATATWMKRVLP